MTIHTSNQDSYVAEASHAQQRLWVMEQMENGAPTYNIQVGLRCRGALDLAVLGQVLDEIIRRHEVLRTMIGVEGGGLKQLIQASATMPLETADLSGQPDTEAAWQRRAEAELRRTFDMASELPVRAHVLRLAADEHVLLLTIDHIACDAWSLRVLHTELTSLYPAFAAGAPSPLPELQIQYADYAAWQRQWLESGEELRQLEYWRQQLADAPPRLALSGAAEADRSVSLTSSHDIPDELIADLEQVARESSASLYSALLAGFGVLISRYARREELVVGSLFAGRNQQELEDLIGFFVNTVGLRLDLSGRPTFSELLGRVHNAALDAAANQDVPFERVADGLGSQRETGRRGLFFDVMFQLADLSREAVHLADLSLEPLPMCSEPAPVDLVVAVLKEASGYCCVWDYQSTLFGSEMVKRMQQHFLALLRAVAADPDRRIEELEFITPQERRVLETWNESDPPADDTWRFTDHFEAVAARTPQAIALGGGERLISYAELAQRADRLAAALQDRGIGPDDIVAIFAERGAEQMVSILAVLKAGGAYLPLDPSYPAQRLAFMIADAAPRLVLSTGHPPKGLPGDVPVLDVSQPLAVPGTAAGTAPRAVAGPDNLAYVIYTSGSTGQPKGVAVTHRGLRVIIQALTQFLPLTSDDRVLQFASLSFDASILEMLMAFGVGAGLYAAPVADGVVPDLTQFLADEEITALMLPPSVVAAAVRTAALPKLRTITVGGEACPPALVAQWSRDRNFFNLYGPTEATIVSTYHQVEVGDDGPVPIGRPLPGVPVYVLDEWMHLVPPGVPGELYVGGQVLARGYLRRPALTAERFVPDPFAHVPGRRLYRTGDLVRWTTDGKLVFLGRIDDQVKIRGFRVELGEIENALRAHDRLRDAVVVFQDAPGGHQEIVGFAVARDGATTGEQELRTWCASTLAPYMVPARIIMLDALPMTGAGKIDRKALMVPDRVVDDAALDESASPLQAAIADVWQEVLGLARIGSADDFFELGGNSLSATQLIIRLRSDLDLDISVRALFDSSTLAEFTAEVRKAAMESE